MSTEANKAIIRRYFEEVRNHGRYELVEELFDPAFRVNRPGLPAGVAGFRAMDAAGEAEALIAQVDDHGAGEGQRLIHGDRTRRPQRRQARSGFEAQGLLYRPFQSCSNDR